MVRLFALLLFASCSSGAVKVGNSLPRTSVTVGRDAGVLHRSARLAAFDKRSNQVFVVNTDTGEPVFRKAVDSATEGAIAVEQQRGLLLYHSGGLRIVSPDVDWRLDQSIDFLAVHTQAEINLALTSHFSEKVASVAAFFRIADGFQEDVRVAASSGSLIAIGSDFGFVLDRETGVLSAVKKSGGKFALHFENCAIGVPSSATLAAVSGSIGVIVDGQNLLWSFGLVDCGTLVQVGAFGSAVRYISPIATGFEFGLANGEIWELKEEVLSRTQTTCADPLAFVAGTDSDTLGFCGGSSGYTVSYRAAGASPVDQSFGELIGVAADFSTKQIHTLGAGAFGKLTSYDLRSGAIVRERNVHLKGILED
jgi:hypothetical protein